MLEDPLDAEEHLTLGRAYESRGEIELAVKEYESALSKDKKSAEVLFFLGNAYFSTEDFEKAEHFYKKALKINKDKHGGLIHNNLAWVYIKKGENFSKAERLCKEAINIDPERSSIYLDTLGVVYFSQKEYELAEQVLLEAIEKIATQSTGIREEVLTHLSEIRNAREN